MKNLLSKLGVVKRLLFTRKGRRELLTKVLNGIHPMEYCHADIVLYYEYPHQYPFDYILTKRDGLGCRKESELERCGYCCWCGKFRNGTLSTHIIEQLEPIDGEGELDPHDPDYLPF